MAGPWEQYQQAAPAESGPWAEYAAPTDAIPAARSSSLMTQFGRSAAGLADTVLGQIQSLPGMAVAETGYPLVRAGEALGLVEPGRAARGREAVYKTMVEPYQRPIGNLTGVAATPEYQSEASQRAMQFIGENIDKGSTWLSAKTGLPKADIDNMIAQGMLLIPGAVKGGKRAVVAGAEKVAPVAREAVTAVKESAPVQAVIKPLQERAAVKQAERVQKSIDTGAQIDAAKLAVKHGIVIDPAVSNPTAGNRLKSTLVSGDFAETAAKINDARFTTIAKEDMGIPADMPLDAKAFDMALSKHSAPYDAVRGLPTLEADPGVMQQIGSLRIDRPAIGGEASAAAVNTLVDEALQKVAKGRSGAEVITDIRKLRKDANNVYSAQQKSGVPDPTLLAKADASIGVANALENLIEANVTDPKLLGELRKARAEMAKIYDYERVTNPLTGRIDPQALAKMGREGKPLSGTAADIAKIAGVFPEVAQTGQTGAPAWARNFTRSGAGGTAGLVAASVFGAPYAPLAAAGAGLGYVGGGVLARHMATPEYQLTHAVPVDFRPPVNNLRPAVPSGTPNLPVPYDFANALIPREQIPNWVYAQPTPEVKVGPQATPPMLEAPSPESTMRTVQQRRRYDYEAQKAAEEAAAAQAEQQAAAGRKPTSGEVLFDLDPVTGKLRPVDKGLKGATPETMRDTGRSLADAAEKIASGRRFAMSAEEKIAWDKTKLTLGSVDAGLNKLSDKAIAEKAMDRAWVEQTVKKAREQADAFEQIARRSKDAEQVRRAQAEREKLLDALEYLEPRLSRSRPVPSGAQGPKTREAIRNTLAERQNQNKLRND